MCEPTYRHCEEFLAVTEATGARGCGEDPDRDHCSRARGDDATMSGMFQLSGFLSQPKPAPGIGLIQVVLIMN